MELGAHDKPAAEGLGRSAEHDSITHCSSLLTACFSSSSPSSLSEEGRTKSLPPCAYQTSITHSPLPTINRLQASTLCCENVKAFCDTLSSVWNHRAPDNVLFKKNNNKKKHVEINTMTGNQEHQLWPWDYKAHCWLCPQVTSVLEWHTARCCANVSGRVCTSLNSSYIQALIVSAAHW